METPFGSILAQLRHEAGLNQRQLAAQLKISQALLSHYENGSREPGLAFVCRVCEHFGISADYVLGRDAHSGVPDGGSAEFASLAQAVSDADDAGISKAVDRYMDAAARRMTIRIKGRDAALRAAQQELEMSKAELELIQILGD